eukprot:gnl/MRDRNA2_/MRDRNA2_72055_c0_seq1.p1 gnl/MRDRNA2_/MRDRNA2_72055_c0~~gnl/MRDRNA2_/MRDRNA2_72055_c0_seq1.p1  ORF type:complete len:1514 (-),score=341.60 gnl/MRDRNA2_/MRDRNA2_72055_c0_seq1:433-4974(-)
MIKVEEDVSMEDRVLQMAAQSPNFNFDEFAEKYAKLKKQREAPLKREPMYIDPSPCKRMKMPPDEASKHNNAASGSAPSAVDEAHSMAKEFLVQGRTDVDAVLTVLRLLFSREKPKQNRFGINPPGKKFSIGGIIGAAGFHTAHLKKNNFEWESTKYIAKLFNKWRDQQQGITDDSNDGVRATCIQINYNFSGTPHVDGNNWMGGKSDIIALGEYEGGEFFIEDNEDFTCERDLISESSGSGSSAPVRTPGIYPCRIEDINNKWLRFPGNIHLHGAEPTRSGERFSLVWFSLHQKWISRLSQSDYQELRAHGFRPHTRAEANWFVPIPVQRPNDIKRYEAGFLFFCRKFRAQVEDCLRLKGEVSFSGATDILRCRWEALPAGDSKDQRSWFAKLEEIHCISQKHKNKPGRGNEIRITPSGSIPSHDAIIDLEEEDEEDGIEDDSDDVNVEAFARLVLDRFPNALRDTNLFIRVLDDFCFAEEDVRSRALHSLEVLRKSKYDKQPSKADSCGTSLSSRLHKQCRGYFEHEFKSEDALPVSSSCRLREMSQHRKDAIDEAIQTTANLPGDSNQHDAPDVQTMDAAQAKAMENAKTLASPMQSQKKEIIKKLKEELIQNEDCTALKKLCFDGKAALVQGLCQAGKSREIARLAWLSHFVYEALPVVFLRNFGGHEAARQLEHNIDKFNLESINSALKQIGFQGSSRDGKAYHLFPKDVRDYIPGSQDAQVLLVLANKAGIQTVKKEIVPKLMQEVEMTLSGKLPIFLIFDEDDENTSSSCRANGVIEQELFAPTWCNSASLYIPFRDAVMQVVSITATPGALALAETRPMQIAILPPPPTYIGLSKLVERHPEMHTVSTEDSQELGFPDGLREMISSMLSDQASNCLGLVHTEVVIQKHMMLQESIVKHFDQNKILVVTHNSGQNNQTRKSENWKEFGGETSHPMTVLATTPLRKGFREFLEQHNAQLKADLKQFCSKGQRRFQKSADAVLRDGDRDRLHQCMTIMKVLSLLRKFREAYLEPIVILVISGHAGGRGMTFRDECHEMCVTDMFLGCKNPRQQSAEHLIQMANRISGVFRYEPKRLKLWTSTEVHECLDLQDTRVNELMSFWMKHGGQPLRKILKDHPDLELTPLAKRHSGGPKVTRTNVEKDFIENVHNLDTGNRPPPPAPLCGGGDVTELVVQVHLDRQASPTTSEDALVNVSIDALTAVAKQAYPDLQMDSAGMTLILLDTVEIKSCDALPEQIQLAIQKSPEPAIDEKLVEESSAHLDQDDIVAPWHKALRQHLNVKTMEHPKTSVRYGRASNLLRPSMVERDYAQAVVQLDVERNRFIILHRTYVLEKLKEEMQKMDGNKSAVFAWRAFNPFVQDGSPNDGRPHMTFMLARLRPTKGQLKVGEKNQRRPRLANAVMTGKSKPAVAVATAPTASRTVKEEPKDAVVSNASVNDPVVVDNSAAADVWTREKVSELWKMRLNKTAKYSKKTIAQRLKVSEEEVTKKWEEEKQKKRKEGKEDEQGMQ